MNEVHLIVAIGEDGAIGKNGDLIWKISDDLKRFKTLTMGHPVIMGRKTWDSLPKKPLTGRRNIIVTRQKDFQAPGAEAVNSIEEALRITENEKPFVMGGAEIYNAFLPYVNILDLTKVDAKCEVADAFLQLELSSGWELIEESEKKTTPEGVNYHYQTFRRIR
ncbi:MAG: dihydrofolate reductase [Muribaculaceae bacterium]|nr:dihydrofolate reductase [Muribaculaceae bacterium]